MAERRMFAKTIVLSDAFLDMPMSARCLYFTLGMLADDDGFVNSPKSIMRQCGASNDDMNVLIAKRFVLTFESGVIVIKHWRINNYLQKDRIQPTKYVEEKSKLTLDKNNGYTIGEVYTPYVYTQDRLGKNSKEETHLSVCKEESHRFVPPTPNEVLQYATEKGLWIDADKFCDFYESKGWMVGKNKMKDWKAAVRGWCSRNKTDGNAPQVQRNAKVQASQGFGTERKNVDYNALVMERIKRQWAEEEET